MLAQFQLAAEAVGTHVKRFTTIRDAVSYARDLVGQGGVSSSLLPADIMEAFCGTVFLPPQECAGASLCVSSAQAGVAATGSLLLDLADQDSRSATSLSPIHAVFLKESTIVPDLYSLHDLIARELASSRTSRLSITTGPSRTADIERVLTIGVHGPKELHVLVIEGE